MNMRMITAAAVLATLAVAGCGSSRSSAPPASASSHSAGSVSAQQPSNPASSAVITIKNFAYRISGRVNAGEKVTVRNEDDVAHTVTSDSGDAFDVNVPASGTASFVAPSKSGRYPFHCTYHSNMHGTLVVT